jgi:multiple sugar transport system permease protein
MVASPAHPPGTAAPRRARERGLKYALVAPSIFVLLLIGIFPLVYLLVVSFQNITMIDVDTSFQGLLNYRLLFQDQRLWESLLHTLIFMAIALPIELVLGLLMAQLFIDHLPGRQVFIALLVMPVVISPIVAGATWSLMFDNRFGPVNQIIGWLPARKSRCWTIGPSWLSGDLSRRGLAVTPFMFCCCSLRCRQSTRRSSKRRPSTVRATGARSGASSCRRSGR